MGAGEPIVSAGQSILCAGQSIVSAGLSIVCAGQPIVRAGQSIVCAGQFIVCAGQLSPLRSKPAACGRAPSRLRACSPRCFQSQPPAGVLQAAWGLERLSPLETGAQDLRRPSGM